MWNDRFLESNVWDRYAHDTLTKFMEERGWDVTRHYKLETAWRAASTYHSKDMKDMSSVRVLGVNSEMDALPVSTTGRPYHDI